MTEQHILQLRQAATDDVVLPRCQAVAEKRTIQEALVGGQQGDTDHGHPALPAPARRV